MRISIKRDVIIHGFGKATDEVIDGGPITKARFAEVPPGSLSFLNCQFIYRY